LPAGLENIHRIKLFYLHSHLVLFKPDIGDVGKEYEESYHMSFEAMDKM